MSIHVISKSSSDESFRDHLRGELAARCARNARYSLRAFANFLGTDHASLSQMLRGKRAITATTVRRLGARIGLDAVEIGAYLARLEYGDAATSEISATQLADDAAVVIGKWHAFAILELMRLAEFRPDVRWIARVLGVDPDEINISLQHLIRLGFLRMAARDRWEDLTGGGVMREEEFTLLAIERIAKRSRELMSASLRNAPDAARLHGTVTLSLNEAELGRLLAATETFLAEARTRAQAQGINGDRLYQLEVHCMPLSNPQEMKGNKK